MKLTKRVLLFAILSMFVMVFCAGCNSSLSDEPIGEESSSTTDCQSHNFTEWSLIAATCTNKGSKTRECMNCGEKESQSIAAFGHTWSICAAKEPTCTEGGWDEYEICLTCNESTKQEKPALNHSIETSEAMEPTCEGIGWNAYEYCTKCNYSTFEELPTLGGHDEIYHSAQKATCTEDGWEAYITCSRCEYSTLKKIASLGHAMDYSTYDGDDNNHFFSCTNEGCEEKKNIEAHTFAASHRCSVCGYRQDSNDPMFTFEKVSGGYKITGYNGYEKRVVIPADYNGEVVVSIGDGVFENCFEITNVTFGGINWINEIGDFAFYGCKNLSYISIPSHVTSIGWAAFQGCTNLSVVSWGVDSDLERIGTYAFSNCTSLTSFTIPESVIFINDHAFAYCYSLTEVHIPKNVSFIGQYAFNFCTSLSSITVESSNQTYKGSGNCIIDIENKTLIAGCKNSVIPTDGSVAVIGIYAFFGHNGLKNIEIPNSVTTIMGCAFGHTSIESVHIPSSVTQIESDAFANCDNLLNISFETLAGWHVLLNGVRIEIDVTNAEQNAMNMRNPNGSEYGYSVWYRED